MRKRYRGLSYGTPLALSDDMILAVLDGQKTHTIRALSAHEHKKSQEVDGWPSFWKEASSEWKKLPGPYGEVGDYLWVRESYRIVEGKTEYRLLSDPSRTTLNSDWMPVVGMPEDCSRICLQIVGYRYLRGIQDIRVRDIIKDGFVSKYEGIGAKEDLKGQFTKYWNTRYRSPTDKWEANPPAWIAEFKLLSEAESKSLKKAKDYLK